MDFLAGSREKITAAISALALLLTGFGWIPDVVPMLGKVSSEVAAGNWQAAFSSFVALALVLMRLFRRLRDDRVASSAGVGTLGGPL